MNEGDPSMNEGAVSAGGTVESGVDTRSAAGVLILRTTESGPRLATLEAGGLVSLPRSEVGPGETGETAARRAARHFVGVEVRLVESLGETTDIVDGDAVSTEYWLGSARLGDLLRPGAQPPASFALRWLDLEEAVDALDSDSERDLVARFALRPQPARQRTFASAEHRDLTRDIEAFRDRTVSRVAATEGPEHLEALLRACDEIERAEGRLARGDDAGARRARARAERETLAVLDAQERVVSLRRALARFPADEGPADEIAVPADGEPVSFDALLAVHTALDAALQETERATARRRRAQLQAAVAIGSTMIAVVLLASSGVFTQAPDETAAITFGAGRLAFFFALVGTLGGLVSESLGALRETDRARRVGLPLGAATGGLAGLALGALLTGGLTGVPAGTSVALTLACVFAAGWFGRQALPR